MTVIWALAARLSDRLISGRLNYTDWLQRTGAHLQPRRIECQKSGIRKKGIEKKHYGKFDTDLSSMSVVCWVLPTR